MLITLFYKNRTIICLWKIYFTTFEKHVPSVSGQNETIINHKLNNHEK